MSKHTPGPWELSSNRMAIWGKPEHCDGGYRFVATCENLVTPKPWTKADAALISIAPDMLDLLKKIADGDGLDEVLEMIERAEA